MMTTSQIEKVAVFAALVLFFWVLLIMLFPEADAQESAPSSHIVMPIVVHSPWILNEMFEFGENGDCPGGCPQEIRPPDFWTASWNGAQPEMSLITNVIDPRRIRSGEKAVKWFTMWRVQDVSLFQEWNANPGNYQASAYVQSWYSACSTRPYDPPYHMDCVTPIDWAHLYIRIGIISGGVGRYGAWAQAYGDTWVEIETPVVALDGPSIVIIQSYNTHPLKHGDVYIDDVFLEKLP